MIRPRSILPAVIVAFAATSTSAATLHVPSEYATIQAGITAAVAGDTVEIACGTYAENVILMKNGVTLRSTTGNADCVVIDPSTMMPPADGGILHCPGDSTTRIEGITFQNGLSDDDGGAIYSTGAPRIIRCRFIMNHTTPEGQAGAILATGPIYCDDCDFIANSKSAVDVGGYSRFVRCTFIDNHANDQSSGGAFRGSGEFVDCIFTGNSAYFDAGTLDGPSITLTNCVFANNIAGQESNGPWGGAAVRAGVLMATGCTFYGNFVYAVGSATPEGATIRAGSGLIKNCIIVGSPCGEECGTVVEAGPGLVIECTNIWHPTENAWAGSIGSQLGQNGNISQDPVFCDDQNGNFSLSSISPCLDAACGTMGAFGLGCFDAKPVITNISDVGNDQGRQVRLTWYRAQDDFMGSPFDGYAIYRRQDLFAAAPEAVQASGRGAFAIPGWDYVTTVPDRADDIYQVIVPTLCDSTITSGQCWSTFFVSALTPTAFYDSPVDSGYSKDNLAPPTPTSFAVSYNTGSGNHLVWDAVAANDWAGFRIYRDDSPGFTPSPATLVHSTTQTTWDDPAFDGWDVLYRVTSFDLAGNESAPTESTPATGVNNGPRPLSLELGPNVPNPFNPSTTIPFTIPSAGRVTITIYDVTGARIRTLVNREYQPGHHSAVWDGRNDAGATVGSGVYVVRLGQLGHIFALRAVLLK
jgi:hypothetical protein